MLIRLSQSLRALDRFGETTRSAVKPAVRPTTIGLIVALAGPGVRRTRRQTTRPCCDHQPAALVAATTLARSW